MKRDIPPPVTQDSSKKDLWEEIQALQSEVSSQQAELNATKKQATRLLQEAIFHTYQLDIIRQVMSRQFGET